MQHAHFAIAIKDDHFDHIFIRQTCLGGIGKKTSVLMYGTGAYSMRSTSVYSYTLLSCKVQNFEKQLDTGEIYSLIPDTVPLGCIIKVSFVRALSCYTDKVLFAWQ